MAGGDRQRSDGELLAATRAGDNGAFEQLYERYVRDAVRTARGLTHSQSAAEELCAEAFARVLRALRTGHGPDSSFGAYLVTTIRNLHFDQHRRGRDVRERLLAAGTLTVDAADESLEAVAERELVGRAYTTLPERWRVILWLTEVEERPVVEIAHQLHLAPNAVAALAYRARDGLRDAWLQPHVAEPSDPACIEVRSWLGGFVRTSITPRRRRLVDAHLERCAECRSQVDGLRVVAARLRSCLAGVVLAAAALALATAASEPVWAPDGEPLRHLPEVVVDR